MPSSFPTQPPMPTGCDIARIFLLCLLFACAGTLLGLTAYIVHLTESLDPGFYIPILIELLVTSGLSIIVSLVFIIAILRFKTRRIRKCATIAEALSLAILSIMYLVGAAIVSRGWPHVTWCLGSGKICQILRVIISFSWILFFLTLVMAVITSAAGCDISDSQERTPADTREIPNNQTTTT